MASATSALSMRGADVDCSRIAVRAVRSHNPSLKATVGSVAPSHPAPCLTRWRREGWYRLGHAVYHVGICAGIPLGNRRLDVLDGPVDLLITQRFDAAGMLQLHLPRHQKRADLQVGSRRLAPHALEHLWPMLLPVLRQVEQKALVERSARSLR